MKITVSEAYKDHRPQILQALEDFSQGGEMFVKGPRNTIKLFPLGGKQMNIKSFRIPNAVNKIAYRFFRKSKAQRSFEYAHALLTRGIGTPYPIAFAEEKEGLLFGRSFYISEQLSADLTYRTLVQEPDYPDSERILRAFTRFTYSLHENHIEFLDHSPGNTLIQVNGEDYSFSLVDLNRMNFKRLDFDARMKNFSRLTNRREMVEIMANEYSRIYSKTEKEVFEKMWFYTRDFQEKFKRKRELKKKLKFWKK